MAHRPPDLLADLDDVLAEVRTWRGQRRRADVKGRRGWVQVELPPKMTERARRALGRELRLRYGERLSPTRSGP